MLLMVENGTRGGICQAIHRYAKANNKYMTHYDENITPSYLAYLDANNLYGWAMSQRLPVNGFEWVEERKKIRKCNELVCDFHYKKKLFCSHKDFKTSIKSWINTKKKIHKVVRFNQKAWLKPYIDINTKLRTDVKNDFEEDFF